jgi:hypothetical protein
LKVLSLTDNLGWIMAVGNDVGYDQIFVQQLMNYGSAGDVLLAISGSGNSPNILAAVDWANRHGLTRPGHPAATSTAARRPRTCRRWAWSKAQPRAPLSAHDVFARINSEGRFAAAK